MGSFFLGVFLCLYLQDLLFLTILYGEKSFGCSVRSHKQSDYCKEIQTYFNEISNFAPIMAQEEKLLGRKIEEGDREALNRLISSNLRFVVTIAKKYSGYGVPFADLIAEGNVGLVKAAYRFDYRKENKFISYAIWWIRQSILDCIDNYSKTNKVESSDLPLIMYESANNGVVSNEVLSTSIYESDIAELEEYKQEAVKILIDTLSEREAEIIGSYFGLDGQDEMTLEEIGKRYNLTKERIRQIKEKALRKMRESAVRSKRFDLDLLTE